MSMIEQFKITIKKNLKLLIIILSLSVVFGVVIGLLKSSKKEWSPPRDMNREYQGDIIQRLRQGQTVPQYQRRRRESATTTERRQQRERRQTAPSAVVNEFAPRRNESYSDF